MKLLKILFPALMLMVFGSACKKMNETRVIIEKAVTLSMDTMPNGYYWDPGSPTVGDIWPDLAIVGQAGTEVHYDVDPSLSFTIPVNDTQVFYLSPAQRDTFSFYLGLIDYDDTKTDIFGHTYWVYQYIIPQQAIHPFSDTSPVVLSNGNNSMAVYFQVKSRR